MHEQDAKTKANLLCTVRQLRLDGRHSLQHSRRRSELRSSASARLPRAAAVPKEADRLASLRVGRCSLPRPCVRILPRALHHERHGISRHRPRAVSRSTRSATGRAGHDQPNDLVAPAVGALLTRPCPRLVGLLGWVHERLACDRHAWIRAGVFVPSAAHPAHEWTCHGLGLSDNALAQLRRPESAGVARIEIRERWCATSSPNSSIPRPIGSFHDTR